jgi:hypothetical protein
MRRTNKLGATHDGQRVAIYARSAADDEAGTVCQDQVRRALVTGRVILSHFGNGYREPPRGRVILSHFVVG